MEDRGRMMEDDTIPDDLAAPYRAAAIVGVKYEKIMRWAATGKIQLYKAAGYKFEKVSIAECRTAKAAEAARRNQLPKSAGGTR